MLSDDTEKNYIYEKLLYAVKSFENPIALCGLTKKFWHFFFPERTVSKKGKGDMGKWRAKCHCVRECEFFRV